VVNAVDLMEKADRARDSARILLDAGDADGACNRTYFALFLTTRACLIAAGGTTGDTISGDKGQVIQALRGVIGDEALKKELFSAWIKASDLRLHGDLGRPVAATTARDLLARIDTLIVSLRRLFPITAPRSEAKTTLMLATGDSAVGNLKGARIGTRSEPMMPNLVWGALPQADLYFAGCAASALDEQNDQALGKLHWLATSSMVWPPNDTPLPGLRELMAQHDQTEIWVNPDANSQLALIFMLDYLGDDTAGIRFYQSPTELGEHPPEHLLISSPPIRTLTAADAAIASRVWSAYCAPTPEAVPPLLQADLSAFPFLHRALLALLEELPDTRDGLGATQRWMLRMVAQERVETTRDLFRHPLFERRPPTYPYWEFGAILSDLCLAEQPALSGLPDDGPFTLDMHEDRDRHRRYFESRLTLTDFGRDLLAGKADFARETRIDRYWGGTRLTNESLWRWDGERRELRR
jgi:uncharacterized protein (UPF0332 family)